MYLPERRLTRLLAMLIFITAAWSCKKDSKEVISKAFRFVTLSVNGSNSGFTYNLVNSRPLAKITFSDAIDESTIDNAVSISSPDAAIPVTTSLDQAKTTLTIEPAQDLKGFTRHTMSVGTQLRSVSGRILESPVNITLVTGMDSMDKFQRVSSDDLLTLVQQQTFKYFWDFGHPVSGLARERNSSGDVVTSGGSGFGIMAMLAAIERNFITRDEGLARMKKIVSFLLNDAETFHGAYSHWLNGATGATVPFSDKDDGADLVETSYLIQGLLAARQYFDGAGDEALLRNDINTIWNGVEWDWFTRGGGNVLYWHWSPDHEWEMNMPIRGWNECLITYVLAASSTTHPINKAVYDEGWAQNGAMANNSLYYGIQLPLGPGFGGPLFFAHYSFLGIDPNGLSDAYANYMTQNVNHTLINYEYCVDNPQGHVGYSSSVWGLTASDDHLGYSAHSPENDLGVISPTAALSSFPYTPDKSMEALEFFYYKMGDKIWGEYGFVDAFNLNIPWFANSYLAIDQGPIIVMIENYRTGLLWDMFMSCTEVKTGMVKLGFTGPRL